MTEYSKHDVVDIRRSSAISEVPEYATKLEYPITVRTPIGVRKFLRAWFQAGWDDMAEGDNPYWFGEGIRCYSRNKTVFKIMTAEEMLSVTRQPNPLVLHLDVNFFCFTVSQVSRLFFCGQPFDFFLFR